MKAKPSLVMDARLINISGIGTFVQGVLPFLQQDFEITLLGNPSEIQLFDWINSSRIIKFTSEIYTLKEQLNFVVTIPACDYFFSPHYNIPLLPIKAKKRVVVIHDINHIALANNYSFIKNLYAKLTIRSALKLSDKILTVSNFSKSEIIKYFHIKANSIHSLTLGVNKTIFRIYNEKEKQAIRHKYNMPAHFVLYVGNVKPHKNLITLIKAYALLKAENKITDHKLVIVGKKGGFITNDLHLDNEINRLNLSEDIVFTGYVEQEDLPIIYNLADLFVFPSYYEGFGSPPVEAMACGCPTLVSNVASLPEIGKEAVAYFNPYDFEELSRVIYMILNDTSRQEQMRIKGLKLVKNYNWQNTAEEIREIILTN